jgi:RimJ/RimL family protein N-acetyltransferase
MEIRWIESQDFIQVIEIENAVWDTTNTPQVTTFSSPEAYRNSLEHRKVAVAVEDDTVLGFIDAFHMHRNLKTSFTLSIGMGVAPFAQRKGVASQLLQWILNYAENAGYKKVSLRVLATNPAAIGLYEKNGFIIEGTLKYEFFLNNQWVDDVIMAYYFNTDDQSHTEKEEI